MTSTQGVNAARQAKRAGVHAPLRKPVGDVVWAFPQLGNMYYVTEAQVLLAGLRLLCKACICAYI